MKNKFKLGILAMAVMAFISACQSEYNIIENGVYLTDAQSSQSKRVTIDDTGATTGISSRLGAPAEQDVTIEYGTDPQALQSYNKKNGTDYQLLPDTYYSFSEISSVIKAGEVASTPVDLIIRPFDEKIDASKKYAVPVCIISSEGADKLAVSSSLMILIDQVIVTTVPYLEKLNYINLDLTDQPIEGLSAWTLEWNVCMDAFNRDNVTQWNIAGAKGGSSIYSRFGDVTCEPNQFQAKIGAGKPQSITRFSAKKWYHLALTYDGSNLRFYVDGNLDFTFPHSVPGETFAFTKISFANNVNSRYTLNGKISELRVWSVSRSQVEIENNMYIVSPDSPGLEVYWKCNEGGGTTIKDYSPNERHGTLKMEATWETGVRFPDDGK